MMPESRSTEYPQLTVPATAVEMELNRLLQDRRFAGAPQMSAFLRYIVTETLAGNQSRIKAYSVGVDALGKPATFDAQNDPSVRVLALRLRKTLALVYSTGEENHAVIGLRVGTYVPEFLPADNSMADKSTSNVSELSPIASKPSAVTEIVIRNETSENIHNGSAVSTAAESKTSRINQLSVFLAAALLVWGALELGMNNADYTTASQQQHDFPLSTDTPTIYLPALGSLSAHEQDISVLVGTSFMQSGRFNVIRPLESQQRSMPAGQGYQMLISELRVDSGSRMDVQLVNLSNNQMVFASTLSSSSSDGLYLKDHLRDVLAPIENMTIALADPGGPLFRSFCDNVASHNAADCNLALLDQ